MKKAHLAFAFLAIALFAWVLAHMGLSAAMQQLKAIRIALPIVLARSLLRRSAKKRSYGQASRLISIGKLNASPRLHTRPITWSSSRSLQGSYDPGRSHLVEGFTLRCIQRFSLPDVATRRCRWRDNRYTRGPSNPVLSY